MIKKIPYGRHELDEIDMFKARRREIMNYYNEHFSIASKLDLDCIEFIFDHNDYETNPLLTSRGQRQIRSISVQTGIRVICETLV